MDTLPRAVETRVAACLAPRAWTSARAPALPPVPGAAALAANKHVVVNNQ